MRRRELELRVLKDEAVAAARCIGCNTNYLLLDSQDYWFDVLQRGYPRVARCSCTSTGFQLMFDYFHRDDGDVRSIKVSSTCAACGGSKRQFTADIDYGDTEHVLSSPLTDCPNPKILYALKELTLYATSFDIARVIDFLATSENLALRCCVRESEQWVVRSLPADDVKRLVLHHDLELRATPYLWIYALPRQDDISEPEPRTHKQEDAFWKRNEHAAWAWRLTLSLRGSPNHRPPAQSVNPLKIRKKSRATIQKRHLVRKVWSAGATSHVL